VPDTLTPGDGQDLFARIKHAWEQRDSEAMLELYREDAEYRIDPFMQPLVGANAIRRHWNEIMASQDHIEFDAERVWVSGRTVLGSWHAALTQRASADRVRVRGFSTMELDGTGLIVRMRDWPVTRTVGIDSSYKPRG
jgi:ketosteroid isomerase-like protein